LWEKRINSRVKTIEKWKETKPMKTEQINIAIAEAIGADLHWKAAKDYCNDLNAMHESEQFLWNKDWSARATFVDHLSRILNPVHGYHKQDGIDLLDATARDRAEAFLKTIGKWEQQNQ
jgi:hypothetical protein